MITQSDIEEMKWKGVRNLEPSQVNELLRLAEIGIRHRDCCDTNEEFKCIQCGKEMFKRSLYCSDECFFKFEAEALPKEKE